MLKNILQMGDGGPTQPKLSEGMEEQFHAFWTTGLDGWTYEGVSKSFRTESITK
jgi:hypothetical protein